MKAFWKFITSLQLTVTLLALSIAVVFFGTLAQVHEGLWTAQERWFRSFIVWWGPQGASWKMPIFVGGYFVGSLLLVNLLASHVKRFQWTWRKTGIHLIHGGIVVFLLSGLFTDRFSRESLMSLREGETKAYSESSREDELIFAADAAPGQEEVISIPGERLAHKGDITHAKLPFTVRVLDFQGNGDILSRTAVTAAGETLTKALATMEAQYALADGLPAQAQRATEGPGREQVWRDSLKAIGEKGDGDIVAAAKRVAAGPAERSQQLLNELKTRFRQQMLQRFTMLPPRQIPTDQALAGARLAERLLANQPIGPEVFPVVADNPAAQASAVFPLPVSSEMDKRNIPYAVVELIEAGKSLGRWLVSPTLRPVEITAGGRTLRMAFRFERYYQPFSLKLLKTTHEVYPGTATASDPMGIPKNFQSRVLISYPAKGVSREVDIFMNNPLNYDGLKFFQHQMSSPDANSEESAEGAIRSSTFQVVKNPTRDGNYLACGLVTAGLLYQFLYHLVNFLNKRAKRAPEASPSTKRARREPEPALR